MKKIVSIIIATMMAISMFAVSVPAMAENVSSPAAVTIADGKVKTTVNGKERQGVTYKINASKPNEVTFTYNGKGTLKSWSDNLSSLGLVEGTDYTITVNKDGSETISFISRKAVTAWNNGSVVVNAVVDFDEATTKASKASKESKEKTTKAKKNTSSKSPATGASSAVLAGGVAAAGAGIAVLAAMKKKEND